MKKNQKKSMVVTLCMVMALLFLSVGCKKDTAGGGENPEYPIEISFTEYSLEDTFCEWVNLDYPYSNGTLISINSFEELGNYINCINNNYPAIDFSKQTLLLASGATSGIAEFTVKGLQQLSENEYELNIKIVLNGTEILQHWTTALIVEKIRGENQIKIQIEEIEWGNCESELFYYYDDEKMFIGDSLLNDFLLIGYEGYIQDEEMMNYISQTGLFNPVDPNIFIISSDPYKALFVNTKEQYPCCQLKEIIERLEQSDLVTFVSLIYKNADATFFYTDEFIVSVKDENDLSDLQTIVEETNTYIKRELQVLSTLYIISANKNSKGNTLQMANYFHETGKFRWAQPNFYHFSPHFLSKKASD